MKLLHIQRTSIFATTDLQQCLLTIKSNDGLLLIDDGCYCLNHELITLLSIEHPTVTIYYVKHHADARAIQTASSKATSIDMKKFVELTFEYDSTITWQ